MSLTTELRPVDTVVDANAPIPAMSVPLRLIRLPEVMARVGIKRSTIYQRMAEGRFPKGRSLGPKLTVWVEAEIDAWIQAVASDGIQE